MKHLFVPYEIALKLKELGFDEDCLGFYGDDGKLYFDNIVSNFYDGINPLYHAAPLYQQVIDWLEEKHNLFIHFDKCYTCYNFQIYKYHKYENEIVIDNEMGDYLKDEYKILAIEEALKLIENKQHENN